MLIVIYQFVIYLQKKNLIIFYYLYNLRKYIYNLLRLHFQDYLHLVYCTCDGKYHSGYCISCHFSQFTFSEVYDKTFTSYRY